MMSTMWVRVNSRVYWASASCWNNASQVGSSMSHSRAIRVMTVAAAPWAKGSRMAGRVTFTSGSKALSYLRRPKELSSISLHVEEAARAGSRASGPGSDSDVGGDGGGGPLRLRHGGGSWCLGAGPSYRTNHPKSNTVQWRQWVVTTWPCK